VLQNALNPIANPWSLPSLSIHVLQPRLRPLHEILDMAWVWLNLERLSAVVSRTTRNGYPANLDALHVNLNSLQNKLDT